MADQPQESQSLLEALKLFGKTLLVVTVFLFLFGSMLSFAMLLSPSQEEVAARKELEARERSVAATVRTCLSSQGPWRCFLTLESADAADPVEGVLRTRELAKITTAKQLLAFCTEPRKVDCADQIVGKGYSSEDILAAMEE